jgi:hypothetical protein
MSIVLPRVHAAGKPTTLLLAPRRFLEKIDSSMSRPRWPEIDAERRPNVNNAIIPHAIRGERRFFSSHALAFDLFRVAPLDRQRIQTKITLHH